MLRRKEEGFKRLSSTTTSGAAYNYVVNAAAATATITTSSGHVLTTSEFISQFDEAARRRLDRMNEKLRGLEMQMEALEAEMNMAIE